MKKGVVAGLFIVIIFTLFSFLMGVITFVYEKWVARQIVR